MKKRRSEVSAAGAREASAPERESLDSVEDDFEECLRLKEITRNRLKLLHPPERRVEKTSKEIYRILELKPPRRKHDIKPFSDRITNPFGCQMARERPKTAPSERQRIPLEEALNFAKRQQEWLIRKNEIDVPELDDINVDQFQAPPANSLKSWKRACNASQKYQIQERKNSLAREKLQKKVEEAKILKQKQKLERLVPVEPSLRPILDDLNDKLDKIRYGTTRSSVPKHRATIDFNLTDDDGLSDHYSDIEEMEDARYSGIPSPHMSSSGACTPQFISSNRPTPRLEDSVEHLQTATTDKTRKKSADRGTTVTQSSPIKDPSKPSPSLPVRPLSAISDSDIPIPQLDADGRVISLYHSGRLIDDWDRLSDSSEEAPPQQPLSRKPQPYVDVHAFLQSVYRRSEINSDDSPSSGEDDDESASVY